MKLNYKKKELVAMFLENGLLNECVYETELQVLAVMVVMKYNVLSITECNGAVDLDYWLEAVQS